MKKDGLNWKKSEERKEEDRERRIVELEEQRKEKMTEQEDGQAKSSR